MFQRVAGGLLADGSAVGGFDPQAQDQHRARSAVDDGAGHAAQHDLSRHGLAVGADGDQRAVVLIGLAVDLDVGQPENHLGIDLEALVLQCFLLPLELRTGLLHQRLGQRAHIANVEAVDQKHSRVPSA